MIGSLLFLAVARVEAAGAEASRWGSRYQTTIRPTTLGSDDNPAPAVEEVVWDDKVFRIHSPAASSTTRRLTLSLENANVTYKYEEDAEGVVVMCEVVAETHRGEVHEALLLYEAGDHTGEPGGTGGTHQVRGLNTTLVQLGPAVAVFLDGEIPVRVTSLNTTYDLLGYRTLNETTVISTESEIGQRNLEAPEACPTALGQPSGIKSRSYKVDYRVIAEDSKTGVTYVVAKDVAVGVAHTTAVSQGSGEVLYTRYDDHSNDIHAQWPGGGAKPVNLSCDSAAEADTDAFALNAIEQVGSTAKGLVFNGSARVRDRDCFMFVPKNGGPVVCIDPRDGGCVKMVKAGIGLDMIEEVDGAPIWGDVAPDGCAKNCTDRCTEDTCHRPWVFRVASRRVPPLLGLVGGFAFVATLALLSLCDRSRLRTKHHRLTVQAATPPAHELRPRSNTTSAPLPCPPLPSLPPHIGYQ